MAKLPAAGRVKTRLAQAVGVARATSFYRHTVAAVVQRLATGPWRTELAVAPDADRHARCWPAQILRVPQGPGDLGRRMQRIFDRAGPQPVVIVGSDIPALHTIHIRQAFQALRSHDAVLGPATDGGYWLIGAGRAKRKLESFRSVRWSGPHALQDTMRNLAGARVALVATLSDVDDLAGFAATSRWCGRRVLPV